MKIPASVTVTAEEAARLRRHSKHHTIVVDGNFAIHCVFVPETGIWTIVDEAEAKELP